MRLAKPKLNHPAEIYIAILRENESDPMRLAQRLQQLGWTLADAAWAAVNWDATLLAAAVADQRQARGLKPTSLSDADLDKLRAEISSGAPRELPEPRRTTRVIRNWPEEK